MLLQQDPDALLVDRIGVSMQQAHCNAFYLRFANALNEIFNRGLIEGSENLPR